MSQENGKYPSLTELKIQFLGLIQEKKYDQAQLLTSKIIELDPNNAVINRFLVFLNKFKEPLQKLEALHAQVQDEDEEDWVEENQVEEEKEENEEDEQGESNEEDEEGEAYNEEEMGYGYYDPDNPSYDQEAYQIQKQQFLSNFQDKNELSTNISQAQAEVKKPTNQNSKPQSQVHPVKANKITESKNGIKFTKK